jgi:uncharacterized protein with FMN-binding domain
MMNGTRVLRILIACAAAVVLAGGCAFVKKIEQITIDDVDVATVKDGSYSGTVRILPVTAKVRVTVKDGAITDIVLVRHFHGPDHGAEEILDRVVKAQSLRVDAVSGATYSSKVVLEAIEAALRKGQ